MAKTFLKYSFGIVSIFLLSTYLFFDNSSAFQHILTFLSIALGFTITALSIIASSNFSKSLYRKESEKDNSKTQLHELTNKFKNSTFSSVTTIVLILVYSFVKPIHTCPIFFWETKISLISVLSGSIWVFTSISIWSFIRVFKLFSLFVIQSAKNHA